jgi:hypothetical protein
LFFVCCSFPLPWWQICCGVAHRRLTQSNTHWIG